jgi:hypothetical protein
LIKFLFGWHSRFNNGDRVELSASSVRDSMLLYAPPKSHEHSGFNDEDSEKQSASSLRDSILLYAPSKSHATTCKVDDGGGISGYQKSPEGTEH